MVRLLSMVKLIPEVIYQDYQRYYEYQEFNRGG